MKKFIFLGLLLSLGGQASVFSFQGSKFKSYRLGSKVYVIQKKSDAQYFVDDRNLAQVKCAVVDQAVESMRASLDQCNLNKSGSKHFCKNLRVHFEDYAIRAKSLGPSSIVWGLTEDLLEVNVDKLKEKVAKKFTVAKKQVVFLNEKHMRIKKVTGLNAFYARMSLFKNVYSLKESLVLKDNSLETTNRLLTCDLKEKKLDLKFMVEYEFGHTEEVAQSIKEKAYQVYEKMRQIDMKKYDSKIVQAAYVGYYLGKALNAGKKTKLNVKDLFNKFIKVEPYNLVLKKAAGQLDFEQIFFPARDLTETYRDYFNVRAMK